MVKTLRISIITGFPQRCTNISPITAPIHIAYIVIELTAVFFVRFLVFIRVKITVGNTDASLRIQTLLLASLQCQRFWLYVMSKLLAITFRATTAIVCRTAPSTIDPT